MKIFMTGGSGFIGARLAEKLVPENQVSILSRSGTLPDFARNIKAIYIKGDISNKTDLYRGMKGSDLVFHLAAFTKPWSKDPDLAFKTNVTGTLNILQTAVECGVKKVIITSTAGTMGSSRNGEIVSELTNSVPELHTAYERTKAEAEKIAIDFTKKGLDVVIVNPTRVFGPGILSKSNSMTKILEFYISGKWRIIPGDGKTIGNYVFVEDVVEGHILAASTGRSGERYILGGENCTLEEFFRIASEAVNKDRTMFKISFESLKKVVRFTTSVARFTGIPPVITLEWLDKYSKEWIMSSEKAKRELGYKITPLKLGIFKTVNWLKSR